MVIALARRAGDPGSNSGLGENFSLKLLIMELVSLPKISAETRVKVYFKLGSEE